MKYKKSSIYVNIVCAFSIRFRYYFKRHQGHPSHQTLGTSIKICSVRLCSFY